MGFRYRPEVTAGVKSLPSLRRQPEAAALKFSISDGSKAARPSDYRVATGDLRDCYKRYFGVVWQGTKPAYRDDVPPAHQRRTGAAGGGSSRGYARNFRAAHRLGRAGHD